MALRQVDPAAGGNRDRPNRATRHRRSCSAGRWRCSSTPSSTRDLLERWLADDRDDDVVTAGLTHDELLSATKELAGSAARRIRGLVRGFLTTSWRQSCPS